MKINVFVTVFVACLRNLWLLVCGAEGFKRVHFVADGWGRGPLACRGEFATASVATTKVEWCAMHIMCLY